MSFFRKLFGAQTTCPRCGSQSAKESFSGIQCPTPHCPNYRGAKASPPKPAHPPPRKEETKPIDDPIQVDYANHRGEAKQFTASRRSIRVRGTYVSLRVAPTGKRISLKRDRIQNPQEIENAVKPTLEAVDRGASPHELHVMRYHQERGTSSPLYESLRAKYGRV